MTTWYNWSAMNPNVYFLVRSWNSFPYLTQCLSSILRQKANNFTVLFVDDASDYTNAQKRYIQRMLSKHIVVFNKTRRYASRNAYEVIHQYVSEDDAIIMNVDGDDWLTQEDVIQKVVSEYWQTGCLLTYGNCQYYDPGTARHLKIASDIDEVNHRYPQFFEASNAYRDTFFLPFHLRTWQSGLFKRIPKKAFLRPNGTWLKTCEDEAMFLPMLEMAKGRYSVISDVLYTYNAQNYRSDSFASLGDHLFDELSVYKQKPCVLPYE
jgi:glycosyltransferase involved in cell wall biosynthesis